MSFGNLKSFPGSSMCSHGWEPLFYVASTTVFLKKTTHLSLSLVLQDLYRLSLDHQTKSAWQTPNMPFLTSPESTCPWGSYSKPIHPFIHLFTRLCSSYEHPLCARHYTRCSIHRGQYFHRFYTPCVTFWHSSLK